MEKAQQREKILSHPKPLSPNQRRAVLSDKQHIRIIAGAGAGKTETLTRRIVYHLIYEEIDPAAIVAFTFTDKAAEGMKSRIYDRLKDLGRDDLRARIGDLYVGTIHGYCFRLLTDYFPCKTEITMSIDLVFHPSRVCLVLWHMGVSARDRHP